MKKAINHSLLWTALSLLSTGLAVADDQAANLKLEEKSANYFVELYAKTCMAYANDLTALEKRFDEAKVPELSKNKAAHFIEKGTGKVWVIPNVYGDFLVSIDKSDSCVVYSRFLNIIKVERAFAKQIERTNTEYLYHKVQDETLATKQGPAHIIRYVLTDNESGEKKNYQLTTSKAAAVEAQIKAQVKPIL